MLHYKHYAYRIIWSEEDKEYIALCAEFPSLSFLHKNQIKALNGIVNLVHDIVKEMLANDEEIPKPITEKKYSGKIPLRTTPELHRQLAIKASEEGVSLNRYLNYKLSLCA